MNRKAFLSFSTLGALALPLDALASAPRQGTGKSFALLVGVEQYENPDIARLNFAVKDVTAVGDLLKSSLGYEPSGVRLLTSDTTNARLKPTNVNVFKALDSLASEIGPEDTFLLYFSGHGFSKEGQSFLGSVNVDPSSIETLQISSVPVATLQSKLKKIKARQILLIMDACRNDPEAGKGEGDNKLTGDFAKSLGVVARGASESGGGSAVLFACSEGERAFEEPAFGHSVFTHFLLEGLSGKAASLGLEDVTEYTAGKVKEWANASGKKQTPDAAKFGTGKVLFSTKPLAAPKPGLKAGEGTLIVNDTVGRLEFTGLPAEAVVTVDGKPVSGGQYEEDMTADTRVVPIVVTAPGFRRVSGKTTIERGKALTVKVLLEKLPAPEPAKPIVSAGKARMAAGASKARSAGFPELAAYLDQMCPIPGGSFSMGSDTSGQSDEAPAHSVTLSDYWLGRHPVTVGVWKEYAKAKNLTLPGEPTDNDGKSFNPGWNLKDHPMVAVSWEEIAGTDGAGGFCAWATETSGVTLTLPSEAQWEYAARDGGKARTYPWGDTFDKTKLRASKEKLGDSGGTLPVYRNTEVFMNSLGLIDMSGNVWQWCLDFYDPAFYGSAQAKGDDPVNRYSAPNQKFTLNFVDGTKKEYDGPTRVLRGGSWVVDADYFRAADRSGNRPSGRSNSSGFRLSSPGPR